MPTSRKTCFVIMPFGQTTDEHTKDYWTSHFEDFLTPLIEANTEIEARRSQPLRGDLLKQIITDLIFSPLVVADLTDRTPNVYWELGVRQSFKHGTITIAEAGTPIPFDIGTKGTLFYYPKNHLKMEEFRQAFKNALEDCLAHPDAPDSYVLETISGRGTLFEITRRDDAIRRLDALLYELTLDLAVLDTVRTQAQTNLENPGTPQYTTLRPISASTELLTTERYIEADERFFFDAANWVAGIQTLNDQLTNWSIRAAKTDLWLVNTVPGAKKQLTELKDRVIVIRKNLKSRL